MKASKLGILNMTKCAEVTFITTGFSNWKKVSGSNGSFEKHQVSNSHLLAKQALLHRLQTIPVPMLKQSSPMQLAAQTALKTIFSSICYLARQGLPLRGHDESEGNLLQLLKIRSIDVPELSQWFTRKQDYTHHSIQNEILQLYSHTIIRNICDSIRQAQHFAIIVDGTQDITRCEQESICIRYVDSDLQPQEAFLGFYAVDSTTGQAMANCIEDVLKRLQLEITYLRAQTFDGAANMSGAYNGCQAIIAKKQPLASYVHCSAHVTNLIAVAASSSSFMIRDAIDCVNELGVLCNSSGKFKTLFSNIAASENGGIVHSLKPLCPTRWLVRIPAIQATMQQYATILSTLLEAQESCSTETAAKASGLHRRFGDGSLLFCLTMASEVLGPLECLNKSLQSVDLTVGGMLEAAKEAKKNLLLLRTDEAFTDLYAKVKSNIKKLKLQALCLPRQKKPPPRLTGKAEAYYPKTIDDYYRTEYFKILDLSIQQLTDRLIESEGVKTYCKLEEVLISGRLSTVIQSYPELLIDQTSFQKELDMFHNQPAIKDAKRVTLKICLTTYKNLPPEVQNMYSNVRSLLRLLAVNPVSSASAERSFSSLRRLKTYVRSTISQPRLNHLAVCHVHKDILDGIDHIALMKEFIATKDSRKIFFGIIQ